MTTFAKKVYDVAHKARVCRQLMSAARRSSAVSFAPADMFTRGGCHPKSKQVATPALEAPSRDAKSADLPLRCAPPQADHFFTAFADTLVAEARELNPGRINGQASAGAFGPGAVDCFPLHHLRLLPHILARLTPTQEACRLLCASVERAAEMLACKFVGEYDSDAYVASLRNNHTAWLFANRLQDEVRNADHLASIVQGLVNQPEGRGWPWAAPFERRSATFAALAAAARARGLCDQSVRDAWDKAKQRAVDDAHRAVAVAAEISEFADAELEKSREEARMRHIESQQAKKTRDKILESCVDW